MPPKETLAKLLRRLDEKAAQCNPIYRRLLSINKVRKKATKILQEQESQLQKTIEKLQETLKVFKGNKKKPE